MDVDGHAATIITDRQRAVFVEGHFNPAGVPGQCFIDTVINHFLGQVIRTTCVGIHTRPLAYRIQSR